VEVAANNDRFLILTDEFAAVLDRLTAQIIARNVAKWVRGQRYVTFIAATTHDDLIDSLQPDVLIEKLLGKTMHVVEQPFHR
jgi:ABC-type ATPase with predicted acetyltransferase domain